MTLPRQVLPNQFYLVTRRCTQRQFLLRPDAETNNAFKYCLFEAARRYDITVLLACAMSNHYHSVIFDRHGRYPEFLEHFHKMLARSQNALRGRGENFWAVGQVSVVKLVDREDVLNKLVYTATNPVKDFLVERTHHWPGFNGLNALLNGRPLRAHRPRHFFRVTGPMPEVVELTLTVPPELGSVAELLEELRERTRAVEAGFADERRRTGRRVCGRREVLRQSWRSQPSTEEPRRTLRPSVAASRRGSRIDALLHNRVFITEYRQARAIWRSGITTAFPAGTYWLHRFASVPLAASFFPRSVTEDSIALHVEAVRRSDAEATT